MYLRFVIRSNAATAQPLPSLYLINTSTLIIKDFDLTTGSRAFGLRTFSSLDRRLNRSGGRSLSNCPT
ncbi:hypothetical protein DPMN_117389 [Dreissena polymorpha]|uniref:Uncharacterized protein n=1 Tax=Dreissena polymorpha TaxID=45954 RepID=A0A9D4QV58_DREPO|nr:hypothetical protein DPMN_117389 [Dreissena polymorpha]